MLEQLADEYLGKVKEARKPKQKASITLDADTLIILEKWKSGNLKETAKKLIELADEILTEREKTKASKASQNAIGGQDAEGQKKTLGEGR